MVIPAQDETRHKARQGLIALLTSPSTSATHNAPHKGAHNARNDMNTDAKLFIFSILFMSACLALIASASHKPKPIMGETEERDAATVWVCGKYCLDQTREDLADSDETLAVWDGTSQYANPY